MPGMLRRMKWFLVGFSSTLLALVSHQILAVTSLSVGLLLLGLLGPLLAGIFSVRKENISPLEVAPPEELVPPAPEVAASQVPEPSYVAFAICDSDASPAPPAPEPAHAPQPVVSIEAAPEVEWLRSLIPLGFHEAVETFKRRLLAEAISLAEGNRAEAARRLGLQRTYLYRLARQLGAHDASVDRSSPN